MFKSHIVKRAAQTAVVAVAILSPLHSWADEGGVSFWVPGFFGSLAAVPQQPGFSLTTIYYHTTVKAGGDVGFARQVSRGGITANFSGALSANLKADAHIGFVIPTYVFATPVLGGQASISMIVPAGHERVSADAALVAAIGPIGFSRGAAVTESVTGLGDLIPLASLRWNFGVHNVMTYITGDIPVGAYNPQRLANLGIGHGAIDGGVGYTYFNPHTGHEFSAVGGLTYNFTNPDTQYKSGVDFHFDMGASQFLSKQVMVGVVGYAYQQLTGDSGSGDRVGSFKSRVFGAGPQIGFIFPLGTSHQGYLNLKGYKEFGAEHRPEGWNAWLTFSVSPAAHAAPTSAMRHMVSK